MTAGVVQYPRHSHWRKLGENDYPACALLVKALIRKKEEAICPWSDIEVLSRTNIHMEKVAQPRNPSRASSRMFDLAPFLR